MKQGFSGKPGALTPLLDEKGRPKYACSKFLWWRTPLFDFLADSSDPFAYTDKNGDRYRPDNHFQTDGGSIPQAARIVPFAHLEAWNFPRAYVLHDGSWQYGGLYIKYFYEQTFKFRIMTRKQIDTMMLDWLRYDDATWWDRRVILNGIALGGWTVWGKDKEVQQKVCRVRDHVNVYDKWGDLVEDNGGEPPKP